MKYRELLAELETLTEEQLDMDVTIYIPHQVHRNSLSVLDEDEYFGADHCLWYAEDDDVLDKNTPIIHLSI